MADLVNRSRSPNYPSISLGDAVEAIRTVYSKERRGRFARPILARHLGYSSLNGRALGKIGALRAYGLIEGREDALSISATALAILEAPDGSDDRAKAYSDAFSSPALFQRIDAEGVANGSAESLRWWLTQQNFIGDAADKALRSYLDSRELVRAIAGGGGDPTQNVEVELAPKHSVSGAAPSLAPPAQRGLAGESTTDKGGLVVAAEERVLASGMLSKTSSYRLIVAGPIGKPEFDKLLAKLKLDEDILADEPSAVSEEASEG